MPTKTPTKAKRTTPKVSPLRGMPVETWISTRTSGWQQDVVRRTLATMARAAPGTTCVIKWGQHVLEGQGPIAYVRSAKAHVTIGFWRGSELKDPAGLLECGDQMGHFKVTSAAELDTRVLTSLVKQARALDAKPSRAKPARRK